MIEKPYLICILWKAFSVQIRISFLAFLYPDSLYTFFLLVLIASDVTSSCPEHSTVVYFSWFLRGQRIPFVESYGNAQWILYSVVKYAFHIDVFLYRWFLRNTENYYIWGQKSVGLHNSIGYLHMESLPRTLTEPDTCGLGVEPL